MSSLIPGPYFLHDALQICVWFAFFGLAVAAHTAHCEEGSLVINKQAMTAKPANRAIYWQPSYRLDKDIALDRSRGALSTGTGFSNAPPLLNFTEPKKVDDWSINIEKQTPSSGGDCSPSTSLLCQDSKEERPDIKPQRDSFWLVFRKAFHF
jgi:hypothetical protein